MREVEVDHRLPINAEMVLVDNLVNGAGGDIARYEVAVFRIPLFQEIPALTFRNGLRIAVIPGFFGHPDAPTFAAC